jgi:hypothetical protein
VARRRNADLRPIPATKDAKLKKSSRRGEAERPERSCSSEMQLTASKNREDVVSDNTKAKHGFDGVYIENAIRSQLY